MTFTRLGSRWGDGEAWKVGKRKFRDVFIGVNNKKLHPTDNFRQVILNRGKFLSVISKLYHRALRTDKKRKRAVKRVL